MEREYTRKKMRELIRAGLASGNNQSVVEALKLDPTYAKTAVTDALKEKATESMSQAQKKLLYQIEQLKQQNKLNPFYTN